MNITNYGWSMGCLVFSGQSITVDSRCGLSVPELLAGFVRGLVPES
jgi:hypothetical protein